MIATPTLKGEEKNEKMEDRESAPARRLASLFGNRTAGKGTHLMDAKIGANLVLNCAVEA